LNEPAISNLVSDRFLAIDVGARGDIPPHWLPLEGHAKFISFDADPEACKELRRTYDRRGAGDRYEVHAVALGSANERRVLYLAKGRGASSVYRPDTPFIRAYTNKGYSDVEQEIEIETRNAGEYFDEAGIRDFDLLKIDIQGAELEVLEALGASHLKSSLFIETEVQFHDRGNGSPTFCDIYSFLTSLGFEVLDVATVSHHPSINGRRAESVAPFGVPLTSPTINRRVWYGDVLFYRPFPKSGDKVLNLTAILCVYGFFSEAYRCIKWALKNGLITETEMDAAQSSIVRFHRTKTKDARHGLGVSGRLWRGLLQKMRLRESPVFPWS
jgi:FkbM family methyltransferase